MLIAIGFINGDWFGGVWAQHLSDIILRRGFALVLVLSAAKLAFTH